MLQRLAVDPHRSRDRELPRTRYRATHKQEIAAYNAACYRRNRERLQAVNHVWQPANRERVNAKRRERYAREVRRLANA